MSRATIATLLIVGGFAASAAPAHSATFQVHACAAALNANNAWTYSDNAPAGQFEHGNGCGTSGRYGGLWLREDLDPLSSPAGAAVYWTFTAPPQTGITQLSYSRYLRAYGDPGWKLETLADNTVLEQCSVPSAGELCERGADGGAPTAFSFADASQLRVGGRCAPNSPDTTCNHGDILHSATAVIYSASVTVSDTTLPTVGTLTGTLTSDAWLRGTHTATITGSDSTGLDLLELRRGIEVVAADDRACDYTRAAPCAGPGEIVASDWGPIDTSQWPDGEHIVSAAIRDAAGNVTATPTITVRTDNTPPAPAPDLVAAGGEGWSSEGTRQLSWTLPDGQVSPIATATLRLCTSASCTTSPADAATSTSPAITGAGEWAAAVALTDEAGNTGAFSAPVTLRYDPDPPPAPTLGSPEQDGTGYDFRIPVTVADLGPAPVASLQGELCHADGSHCTPLAVQASTTELRTSVPGAGTWQLRVRAVDAAGNTGPTATATLSYTLPAAPPTPTPQPTPAPSSQPPATLAVRRLPALRITRARLRGRRLEVRGTLPHDATGPVRLTVRFRIGGRDRRVTRRVRPHRGRFHVTLHLPRRIAESARLQARFGGDARYRPRGVTRTLRL
jgi:hypothetical protein